MLSCPAAACEALLGWWNPTSEENQAKIREAQEQEEDHSEVDQEMAEPDAEGYEVRMRSLYFANLPSQKACRSVCDEKDCPYAQGFTACLSLASVLLTEITTLSSLVPRASLDLSSASFSGIIVCSKAVLPILLPPRMKRSIQRRITKRRHTYLSTAMPLETWRRKLVQVCQASLQYSTEGSFPLS